MKVPRITRDMAELAMAYVLACATSFAVWMAWATNFMGFRIFVLALIPPAVVVLWQFLFGMQAERDRRSAITPGKDVR